MLNQGSLNGMMTATAAGRFGTTQTASEGLFNTNYHELIMNATRSQVNDKLHGRSTSGSLLPTGRKNYM